MQVTCVRRRKAPLKSRSPASCGRTIGNRDSYERRRIERTGPLVTLLTGSLGDTLLVGLMSLRDVCSQRPDLDSASCLLRIHDRGVGLGCPGGGYAPAGLVTARPGIFVHDLQDA